MHKHNHISLQPLIMVIIFILSFIFFLFNIFYFSPITYRYPNNVVYSTDTGNIVKTFSYDIMEIKPLRMDNQKHPLFFIITYLIMKPFNAFGMGINLSFAYAQALTAAISIVLVYYALLRMTGEKGVSLAFTLFYALSYSSLVFYSIPSYFALSNIVTISYTLLVFSLGENPRGWKIALLLIYPGLGALFTPPLMILAISNFYVLFRKFNLRKAAALSLIGILISVTFWMSIEAAISLKGLKNLLSLGDGGQWNNLTNHHFIGMMIQNFLFVSIINPGETMADCSTYKDYLGYLASPLKLCLIMIYVAFLVFSAVRAVRVRKIHIISILLFSAVLFLYYLKFNPGETMAYSPTFIFPPSILMADSFSSINLRKGYWLLIALFAVICLLALANIMSLYGPLEQICAMNLRNADIANGL